MGTALLLTYSVVSPWGIYHFSLLLQVLSRMLWSMIPTKIRYLELLKPNADLYGPFWVPMTLLFCIAIAGNLTKFLTQSKNATWEFHFNEGMFIESVL